MSAVVQAERIEIVSGVRKRIEEPVAMEAPVNIYVNENHLITLLSTPRLQRELALGWLFDQGVLQSQKKIERVTLDENNVIVRTKRPLQKEKLDLVGATKILTSACGLSTNKFLKVMEKSAGEPIRSDYTVKAGHITSMIQQLDNQAELFKLTGGTHASALFEDGELVAFAEDIGRHNAIDKAIGISLQSDVDFSRCVLVSSGRQPADMVLKAARMGIPVLASKASPIRSGIIAARKAGVTLVCFVRQQRMTVYTHPDRILIQSSGQNSYSNM